MRLEARGVRWKAYGVGLMHQHQRLPLSHGRLNLEEAERPGEHPLRQEQQEDLSSLPSLSFLTSRSCITSFSSFTSLTSLPPTRSTPSDLFHPIYSIRSIPPLPPLPSRNNCMLEPYGYSCHSHLHSNFHERLGKRKRGSKCKPLMHKTQKGLAHSTAISPDYSQTEAQHHRWPQVLDLNFNSWSVIYHQYLTTLRLPINAYVICSTQKISTCILN